MTIKPFLKWPGRKFAILHQILPHLTPGDRLLEPFVGSGSVFLNSNYSKYVLADNNPDLINLYNILRKKGHYFITLAKSYITKNNNQEEKYYEFRELFNCSEDTEERSALFIYLNRHGYNGLCRYNSKGYFNVPFGRYKKPYFPEDEMIYFYKKSRKQAEFVCVDFSETLINTGKNDVVYCDPPYLPLNSTNVFTEYSQSSFTLEQHKQLAELARLAQSRGAHVLISNHDTPMTRCLYEGSRQFKFEVPRYISCDVANRRPAKELLALFAGENYSR